MVAGREGLRTFVVGLCMGAAEAVPGVSGGTIALIAGVYERLIAAVTGLTPGTARRLFRALAPPSDRDAIDDVLDDLDVRFLLPLGLGMVTAVVSLLRVVSFADDHHPVLLFGFFFGLIAASLVVLSRTVVLSEPRHVVGIAGGFLLAFVLSGDLTLLSGHGPVLVFLAGSVAISGMILPGISGSLVLVILGQYVFLSDTLSTFADRLGAVFTGGSVDGLAGPGTTVAAFVLGGLVGLFTISRAVDRAFDRDPATTLAFLVGLVAGALRAPVSEIGSRPALDWTGSVVGTFGVAAVFGAAALLVLDRYSADIELRGRSGSEVDG